MASNYLDKTGLSYFWSKIKNLVETHTNNKNNPHNVTASQIGAASATHTHSADQLSAGTLAAGVVAATGIDDNSTSRLRNIQAGTADLTAGTSSLETGTIYLVYE